jgi:hypothetical protein
MVLALAYETANLPAPVKKGVIISSLSHMKLFMLVADSLLVCLLSVSFLTLNWEQRGYTPIMNSFSGNSRKNTDIQFWRRSCRDSAGASPPSHSLPSHLPSLRVLPYTPHKLWRSRSTKTPKSPAAVRACYVGRAVETFVAPSTAHSSGVSLQPTFFTHNSHLPTSIFHNHNSVHSWSRRRGYRASTT